MHVWAVVRLLRLPQARGRLDAFMAPMLSRVGPDGTSTHCHVALLHVFFNVEQSDKSTLAAFVSSRLRRGWHVHMLEHLGTRFCTRFVCQAAWGVGGVDARSEFIFQFAFLCVYSIFVNKHLHVYIHKYVYIYICVNIYICVYICVNVYTYRCVFTNTLYIYTETRTET